MGLESGLKLVQSLSLNAHLRQMLTLLNLSSIELDDWVNEACLDNPLLERDTTEDIKEPVFVTASVGSQQNIQTGEQDLMFNVAQSPSLWALLQQQVGECRCSDNVRQCLYVLIDYLDEHGYLSHTLPEIMAATPLTSHIDFEDLTAALQQLQTFSPAGVGARDLRESMSLQLLRKSESEDLALALCIVDCHFDILGQGGRIEKLSKKTGADKVALNAALDIIQGLNPYPDYGQDSSELTLYIRPDILLKNQHGYWSVILNTEATPRLFLNQAYVDVLKQDKSNVWQKKIQDAKNLIGHIEMRNQTLLRVAEYIVDKQQDFFKLGASALKPLDLKQVAGALDLHISTISRTVRQKYILCPQGLLSLSDFFSTGIATVSAGEKSVVAIKNTIRDLIASENKARPYSDQYILDALQKEGIKLSRRTVCKYRESMRILPAYLRKNK